MIDKDLMRLLDRDKKYVFMSVAAMLAGFVSNVITTALICRIINLALNKAESSDYILSFICIAAALIMRYIFSRVSGKSRELVIQNYSSEEMSKRVFVKKYMIRLSASV